jgi:hypothetical protein
MTADCRILTARCELRVSEIVRRSDCGRDSYLLARNPLLIGSWSAKLPNIASAARRDAQEHKLTDRQRAKLKLAGRGDIKRFFDRVEESRIDFEVQRQTFRTGRTALLRLDPLLQVYREGPFGDGSLFAKTLRRISDDPKVGD